MIKTGYTTIFLLLAGAFFLPLNGDAGNISCFPLVIISANYPAPYLTYGMRFYLINQRERTGSGNAHFADGGATSWAQTTAARSLDISLQAVQPFSKTECWGLQFETRWSSLQLRGYSDRSPWRYRWCSFKSKLSIFIGSGMLFDTTKKIWITTGISYSLPRVWKFTWNLNGRYNFDQYVAARNQISVFQLGLQLQINSFSKKGQAVM